MQYGCCSHLALVSRTFCDWCMVFTLCYMTLVHFQHWWVGRSATGVWCSHCAIWLLYTFSTGESDVLRPVYGVHTVLYDSCTLSALVSRTFCDRCMVFTLCYMTLVHFQHWWVGRSVTSVWCSHCAIWLLYTFSTGESDVLRPVYGVHTVLYDSCTLSALVSRTFCDRCMVFTLCYMTLVHFQHWWVGRSATGVWCSYCAIRLLYTFSTGESDVLRPVYGVHTVLYDSCTLSALVSRTFCDQCMVFTLCYMTLVHFQHWWVGRSATGVWCSHCAIWLLYTFSTGESDVLRPVYGVHTVLYDSCTLSALVSRTFCDRCMVFTLCYMTLVHFQHWWVGRSVTGVWCSHCAIRLLYTFSTGESDVLRPVYGVHTVLYDSCTLSALVSRTFCDRCMVFTLCYMTLVHFQRWWVGRSATGVWCSHCAIWLLFTFSAGESDVLRPVYGVHTVLYDSCTLSALVSRTFCDRCMVFKLCYMTLVHFQHWWVGRSATGVWCSHCAIRLLYTFSTGESDVLRPVYGVHTVLYDLYTFSTGESDVLRPVYGVLTVLYDSCTLSALVSRTFCNRCMVFILCYTTVVHFQHWWVGRSVTGVWCSHCAIQLLYTFSAGESGRSATGVWCSHCAIWLLYTFSTGESDVLRPVYGVHTVLYDSCTLSALVSRTFCDRCMVFKLCYMTLVHFQHWWVGRSATGVWCSHCAIRLLYTFSTGESDVLRPVYGVHTVLYDLYTFSTGESDVLRPVYGVLTVLYDSCTLSALVSRTFCNRCMVFILCYTTVVHFQHWWVGRSVTGVWCSHCAIRLLYTFSAGESGRSATGVWCSHCAIWLLYTFSTGESDVLRPVYGVHTAIRLLYTFSTGESDVLRLVYGVHTVLYDSCTLSALVSRTFCDRCMVFTLCYMTLVHFQHWWVGRSATGVWCSHCAIRLLYTFSTGESDVLQPVYGVHTVLYDSCTLSALVSRTFCDRCMVFTLCYMTLVHFQHWWVGRSATGVWCSHCAIRLLYTFSTGESDVLWPVYGVHTVLYDSCTLSALVSRDVLRLVYGVHTVLYDSCTLSALVSRTFCDRCMVFTLCYTTLVHFQHWWVGRSATGVWCSHCAIRLLYTFSTGESDVLRPVYGVHTVLYDSCTLSALVSRTFCDWCMVFTLCYMTLVHFQHWWVGHSATGVWCSHCAIWLLYTFSTGGAGCSSWCDGSSDRSFMGWNHWAISRSSQCSTTGVTKAVVCVILSVGWCI